MQRLH